MLVEILESDEITDAERTAFTDMMATLESGKYNSLSTKQADWVRSVHTRLNLDEPEKLVSRGEIPRGKEVPTPEVLKNLPKRPPGRS